MTSISNSQSLKTEEYKERRNAMVENNIITRGIKDEKVLDAMRTIERHFFVSDEYKEQAYNDYPLPIGENQTISQPYIVALMTEKLQLRETDKILEIGTGSGYQTAILAEICDSVYTIEIFETLGEHARQILTAMGYTNAVVKVGDGYQGWPEHAPYDGIIVTCAPTHLPEAFKNQLKEGGILVIPVGKRNNQVLNIYVKKHGKLKVIDIVPVRFVPMINVKGEEY